MAKIKLGEGRVSIMIRVMVRKRAERYIFLSLLVGFEPLVVESFWSYAHSWIRWKAKSSWRQKEIPDSFLKSMPPQICRAIPNITGNENLIIWPLTEYKARLQYHVLNSPMYQIKREKRRQSASTALIIGSWSPFWTSPEIEGYIAKDASRRTFLTRVGSIENSKLLTSSTRKD